MRRILVVFIGLSLVGFLIGWGIRGCVNDCRSLERRGEDGEKKR